MKNGLWAAIAIATSLVLHPGGARADDEQEEASSPRVGRLPLPHAARPITLPSLVLEPLSQIYVDREAATLVNLRLGAAFGITDDLEVDTVIAPLKLSPPVTYAELDQPGPEIGATYRLVAQRTQLALHVDATAITLPAASGAVLRAGLPVHSRAGNQVRIDYGVLIRATYGRTNTYAYDLPFVLAVDLAPPLHIGFRTGLTLPTTAQAFSYTVPLGIFVGYAVQGSDGPILDIEPFVLWPQLLGGGTQGAQQNVPFQVGIALKSYFYL